jgi:hypothetical protein
MPDTPNQVEEEVARAIYAQAPAFEWAHTEAGKPINVEIIPYDDPRSGDHRLRAHQHARAAITAHLSALEKAGMRVAPATSDLREQAAKVCEEEALLLMNSARSALGLIEGGQELLVLAIKAGDPQRELLFRANEDRDRAAHAGKALDAFLDRALPRQESEHD